ncbi:MAG: YjgN family protein [Lysobacterales bacterium]
MSIPFDAPDRALSSGAAFSDDVRALPFRFTGRSDEYFRIWIVNLALTIVTLGVYSAWAKVRSERYFYGNTSVGGTPFEYLADPIAILKGRALAALLLLVYFGSAQISPFLNLAVLFVLMLMYPWMLSRSLTFRARYSAWRSIRFGFDGSYGEAFKYYILFPIASVFSLYLAFPLVARLQTEWMATRHRYGGTRLRFHSEASQFYAIYLLAFVGMIGVIVTMVLLSNVLGSMMGNPGGGRDRFVFFAYLTLGTVYLLMFAVGVFVRAATANLMFNGIEVGDCRFKSSISGWDMAWIFLTNTLAILCSLGLLYPWARIRVAKYRADHLQFLPSGDPDQFFADAASSAPAFGSEAADLFDLDLSW